MKSFLIETFGVYLGMATPCMGGWLVQPAGGRPPFWTWGYGGLRDELEAYFSEVH
jgi:hypothetical protein